MVLPPSKRQKAPKSGLNIEFKPLFSINSDNKIPVAAASHCPTNHLLEFFNRSGLAALSTVSAFFFERRLLIFIQA